MAEFVQQSIEEMLPELEQMKRVELFTEKETRTILRKRKAYEYKLRRRTKQKEDYLQYIQYEINVLSLVKKRRKSSGYQYKQLEIDVAIINRIHKLFKLACWRFQDDVNMWLSHIDFCKRRRDKAPVGNLYLRMLQIHNKKPGLWVLAAKWEMEDSNSMENARGLLQRGLRFNSNSQLLWQEYFRMELLSADKIRKRREILGLASLDKDEVNISDVVLEGHVALVVLKKALETIPEKVQFCLSFLPICRLFDFASHIEEEIFSCLRTRYSGEELTWEALALQTLLSQSIDSSLPKTERERLQWEMENEAAEIFNQAVLEVKTEKMWSLYIIFCKSQMEKKSSRSLCDKRVHRVLSVFQQASDSHKLTPDLYNVWVDVLSRVGGFCGTTSMEDVLHQALIHHPHSASLWVTKLRVSMTTGDNVDQTKSLVDEGLQKVTEKESYPIWEIALLWAKEHCSDYAETLFERGILCCAEICVPLKKDYLEWAVLNNSIAQMRTIYNRLSSIQPLSVDFFFTYIDIESMQTNPKIKKIRKAYEDAIREYGSSNTELWLNYIKLETIHPKGKPQEAGQIHWRAMKTLDGELTEKFVTMYTLLQTGHL